LTRFPPAVAGRLNLAWGLTYEILLLRMITIDMCFLTGRRQRSNDSTELLSAEGTPAINGLGSMASNAGGTAPACFAE
jgi:hypothetical protein